MWDLPFPEWVRGWWPGTDTAPVCSAVADPFPATPPLVSQPGHWPCSSYLPGAWKPAGSRGSLCPLLFLS